MMNTSSVTQVQDIIYDIYGWREEREESNYILVAQPKKCMFKVNNISAMYKICSTLTIRHQDIDEITLDFFENYAQI